MKATTWLCPVLTLLCATKLVYTAQRGSYGSYHPTLEALDSSATQNDYFLLKRNKPSLSIVNPLDVLRQRLLLEIARRQMKENTRQVELNRAILKNVGKRMLTNYPHSLMASTPEQQRQQQQQQHQQWEETMTAGTHKSQRQQNGDNMQRGESMLPYDLELIPSTLIFDYLQHQQQRPWLTQEKTAILFDGYNNAMDGNDDLGTDADDNGDEATMDEDQMDVVRDVKLSLQHQSHSDEPHEISMKKPINRSGHEGNTFGGKSLLSSLKHQQQEHKSTFNNDSKLNDLATLGLEEGSNGDGSLDVAGNSKSNNNNNNSNKNANNEDNQVQRYLYHLHKNHLTRK
ncbi:corticotropin-releasing diuretic hormone 44 [Haematobia irritans]|uniref:corticotropin-releasing diuretic hormone 44 n=1 Tax=Haematobia irritans TaxID=7368 RepID=UPI003F50810C